MNEDEFEDSPTLPEDDAPEGINEWAISNHLEKVEDALARLAPRPWGMHPDPDRPDSFYLSGPPGTKIVADNLDYDDASALLTVINGLPEIIDEFEDLSQLWNISNDGVMTRGYDDFSAYLGVISKYQTRIAQLEGNPSPVPVPSVAGDLSYMHVGHHLRTAGEEEINQPIISVTHREDYVRVTLGSDASTLLLLPESTPVEVVLWGRIAEFEEASTPAAEVLETPVPEVEEE